MSYLFLRLVEMDLCGVLVWILFFGMVFSVFSFLEETEKE